MRVKCLVISAAAFIVSVACFAEPIPKYLELARELVATVKPENNKYSCTGSNGVRLKGDLNTWLTAMMPARPSGQGTGSAEPKLRHAGCLG